MTQMKDVAWPQPTYNEVSSGSPFGTTTVKTGNVDKNGTALFETIVLNRATRRRYAVLMATRLERLVDREERDDKLRRITRTDGTKKQQAGRKARAAKRVAYLARAAEINKEKN